MEICVFWKESPGWVLEVVNELEKLLVELVLLLTTVFGAFLPPLPLDILPQIEKEMTSIQCVRKSVILSKTS